MPSEDDVQEENLDAKQVDAQRARHLLNRALSSSENGDVMGAIVTCRRAIALAPTMLQAWSMLGLLYERNNEIDNAIKAYEQVLELSPSSALERESLQRLKLRQVASARPAPKSPSRFERSSTRPAPDAAEKKSHNLQTTPSQRSFQTSFYFRSLPFALAAIVCIAILISIQRSAFQNSNAGEQNNTVMAPASATLETPAVASQATPPPTPVPAKSTSEPTPATSSSPTTPTTSNNNSDNNNEPPMIDTSRSSPMESPVPRPETAPKSVQKSIFHPQPTPSTKPKSSGKLSAKPRPPQRSHAAPSEMPVLPPPQITFPERHTSPHPPKKENTNSTNQTNNHSEAPVAAPNNKPTNVEQFRGNGGGPVDVGNSADSKYIPINPPSFPDASRG